MTAIKTKNFKSTTGKTIQLALESGIHIAYVHSDGWTSLSSKFWRLAMKTQGVVMEGAEFLAEADEEQEAFELTAVQSPLEPLKKVMRQMMQEPDKEGNFNNSGTPNRKTVSKLAGYNVSQEESSAAWNEIMDELEPKEDSAQ